MSGFFDNDIYWKSYIMENILIAKMLYDRGFNVAILDIHQPMLASVIDMLFGESEWGSIPIELPQKTQEVYGEIRDNTDLTYDQEETYCYINDYMTRDHYKISINIDLDGLEPRHYNRLMSILKKYCYPVSDDLLLEYYPAWELVESAGWIVENKKITGIWLHFIDVQRDTEDPVSDLRYHEAFIQFWDTLQEIRKEQDDQHTNPRRRECVCQPEREGSDQGEANRPGLPVGSGERIVA